MTIDAIDLDLAKCHYPVRGLGWGRRTGIWLQGCSIRCRGCIVPETWQAAPEHRVPIGALLERLLPWIDQSDGVTVSGGEPFDQPDSLVALLSALRTLTSGDLLVYSGYPWKRLVERHGEVLAMADAVVSEPFVLARRTESPVMSGSDNQRVHLITALGHERYADWRNHGRTISIAQNGGALDLAGLLAPGELRMLTDELNGRGWSTGLTHAAL